MNDQRKSKAQLIRELNVLRNRIPSIAVSDSLPNITALPSDSAEERGSRIQFEEKQEQLLHDMGEVKS